MNISIFAALGAGNIGDELIVKNEIDLLKQEFWDNSVFRLASYDIVNPVFRPKNTRYFEYFPIWIRNPKNILRNIKNFGTFIRTLIWSDIVVIGWGWIIYDNEYQSVSSPLKQWYFRVKLARIFRKKVYFYAVGVDITNEENLPLLRKIFTNAWKIAVRDIKSQKQLEGIGIQSKIVDDPVMSEWHDAGKILGTHAANDIQISDFESYDFFGKKVWLALRKGYLKWEEKFIENLCTYIEKKWGKVVFLPHSIHPSDEKANDYIYMKQFLNYEREIYVNLAEVYTVYSHKMLDVVVSMRLHSMILSRVYGIPQIALSYSKKTDELLKKLS